MLVDISITWVLFAFSLLIALKTCDTKKTSTASDHTDAFTFDTFYYSKPNENRIQKIVQFTFIDSGYIEDGTTIFYYPNGEVLEELEYRHGKPWNHVYTNDSLGNMVSSKTLSKGNGYLKRKIPNTEINFKVQYLKGLSNGLVEKYFPNDSLSLHFYRNNEKNNGLLVGFFKSGDTSVVTKFINAVNVGPMKFFAENGKLEEVIYFKTPPFNKQDSTRLYNDMEGSLSDLSWSMDPMGLYNGIQDGPQYRFDTLTGAILDSIIFIEGERVD